MSIEPLAQPKLSLHAAVKRSVRSQFGAICYRVKNGKTQILLVTSRTRGRWITPKGWPVPGQKPAGTAKREAWEEAGAEGRVHKQCLGIYSYTKNGFASGALPCVVALYALKVKKLSKDYPEKSERKRKWFTPKKAAAAVHEPELQKILRSFDPKALNG